MEKSLSHIEINLDYVEEGLILCIDENCTGTLFELENALEQAEAQSQLVEGHFYDYEFSNSAYSFPSDSITQPFKRKKHIGRISPNIYVGTLSLQIFKSGEPTEHKVEFEVRSKKIDYRNDYRFMLEEITAKCTDLLLQRSSPITQSFEVNPEMDYSSLYQRFSFLKSVVESEDFEEAVNRIISFPVTTWREYEELSDVRRLRKVSGKQTRAIVSSSNRVELSNGHYLRQIDVYTLPCKIPVQRKTDHFDTSENRFFKHALETFLYACEEINFIAKEGTRLKNESEQTVQKIESYLQHNFFQEISRASNLKLNSPVLQRKEGYREVLRAWLMFDLAAKLVWKGGEDVYNAGKKDIANLYEYWLFFVLLDLVTESFDMDASEIENLIEETKDGLGLQLKQGSRTVVSGFFDDGTRKLKVEFNYNRTFGKAEKYPDQGSWTVAMRPDYTLSIWPAALDRNEAEIEEVIVHIHFDAKYKVEVLEYLNKNKVEDLSNEKTENREGKYKRIDLLKMHAYKDAIRRTSGAYVLYPGKRVNEKNPRGFHEIIPGLGAFAIRPEKNNIGTDELKLFLKEVTGNLLNRISQRERLSYKTYDIMHSESEFNILREPLPEIYGSARMTLPDETYVLVGYCKDNKRFEWYKEMGIYNFRMDDDFGSLELTNEVSRSKFLLLRNGGDTARELFRIKSDGPKVFSGLKIQELGYPTLKPKDYYLVIEIEVIDLSLYGNSTWNFKELKGYKEILQKGGNPRKVEGKPFTTTLSELMKNRTKS